MCGVIFIVIVLALLGLVFYWNAIETKRVAKEMKRREEVRTKEWNDKIASWDLGAKTRAHFNSPPAPPAGKVTREGRNFRENMHKSKAVSDYKRPRTKSERKSYGEYDGTLSNTDNTPSYTHKSVWTNSDSDSSSSSSSYSSSSSCSSSSSSSDSGGSCGGGGGD